MNRMNLRTFLLSAVVCLALPAPALSTAQEPPGNAPEAKAPVAAQTISPQTCNCLSKRDQGILTDFADLARFHDADEALGPPAAGDDRVVFMGDSITQGWHLDVSFPGKPYINRGISGQTSPQMLVRFRQDVIDLKPKVVIILAGTNDIAENTGPMTQQASQNNIISMVQLATANGIQVVLCSVLPSTDFWWHRGLHPAPKIVALNKWIKAYAAEKGYPYVNYYSAMADAEGGLPKTLSNDGVHPSPAGYAVMAPLAEAGIEKALNGSGQ